MSNGSIQRGFVSRRSLARSLALAATVAARHALKCACATDADAAEGLCRSHFFECGEGKGEWRCE